MQGDGCAQPANQPHYAAAQQKYQTHALLVVPKPTVQCIVVVVAGTGAPVAAFVTCDAASTV
jgi:hypothetical protein